MMSKNLVGYYRVSTQRQKRSGLGLEAQQAAVGNYSRESGGTILAEYTEAESGRKADRPELAKAIAHAKRGGAKLVVAKLDRLSRNARFLLTLKDSGLPLVFCDLPGANELVIGIMAVIAEDEARRTSARTKAALAAAKRKGKQLGAANPRSRNLTDDARRRGNQTAAQAVRKRADEGCEALRDVLSELRPALSYQQIATVLNLRGERTRRGKPWTDVAVIRAYQRLGIND